MIDVHTHLTYVLDSNRIGQAGRGAATVYLSQDNAKKTLETGVTTVRNLGASDYADIAMRDLINAGMMAGPRMFVSGYGLFITRGGRGGPGTADGVAEVLKVVRQQVGAGADVIKMYGSTGSGQDVSGDQTFTYKEMKAAVDAAHALGKRIAIHTYGPTGARDAVHAGADSVEHATDMDDATIVEMARKSVFLCADDRSQSLLRG
jgi:imidazolonepropionase-like amidohydrolase